MFYGLFSVCLVGSSGRSWSLWILVSLAWKQAEGSYEPEQSLSLTVREGQGEEQDVTIYLIVFNTLCYLLLLFASAVTQLHQKVKIQLT